MSTRTDIHRPSALVPSDYDFCDSYFTWVGTGGLDCQDFPEGESDMEVFNGLRDEELFGGSSYRQGIMIPCDVCGARHKFGALFFHRPTRQYVKMGRDCADKYSLAMDLAAGLGREASARDRLASRLLRMERRRLLREFVRSCREAGDRALLADLRTRHDIVSDIRKRVIRFGSISEGQAALVTKIAREVREREANPEVHVPAPIEDGRQVVEGVVVSVKLRESDFGDSWKMTVKVHTPDGSWLCWGTAPSSLLDRESDLGELRGSTVRFSAKLKPGRDPHFALFSRPTKAVLVSGGEKQAEKLAKVEKDLAECQNLDYVSDEYKAQQARLAQELRELLGKG